MARKGNPRAVGVFLIIAGIALRVVAVGIWWTLWEAPPGETDVRILLTPPTLALALISFGIWMITTGKQPEPGPPRYPYAFGRNTETRTRAKPPDEAHDR